MMHHQISSLFLTLVAAVASAQAFMAAAADPTATDYSFEQCSGSLMPYPTNIRPVEYPDSLEPVLINHVGRHGSRFPASAANTKLITRTLEKADSLGTITAKGRKLLALCREVSSRATNRWGALDSLGMAEQRGIASRMFMTYAPFLSKAKIHAISSYSPRVMMSMYEFTHQLDRLDNHIEFSTTTGRQNSPIVRPFDIDQDYIDFRREEAYKDAYDTFFAATAPTTPIERVAGTNYPYTSDNIRQNLSLIEYYVIAGCAAMSVPVDPSEYFTKEEYNALWSCFNLRQYLQRTASTISSVPADIASALLSDLISTTDAAVQGKASAAVELRFGHAETLMPLLSLMRLQGCYYLTNYFDTVALHWRDFDVVPMAANLQLILFKNSKSGRFYLRTLLNEQPVALIPNDTRLILPWAEARAYLEHCLPLYKQ